MGGGAGGGGGGHLLAVVRTGARGLGGLLGGVRRARATLAGGWHDVGPVVARLAAPARESVDRARAVARSARRRLQAQAAGLRAALRLRR